MAKASDFLIAVDDGHGINTTGKRTPFIPSIGRYIPENEFNRAVAALLVAELKRCGFRVLETAPGDTDHSLKSRVDRANNAKANLLVSIHYNAIDGKFDGAGKDPEGFSAHIDKTRGNSEKFARIALKHLAEGTPQKNRGLVIQDLYITRESKMPAVLFELGFMDNNREALLMISKAFQTECATEIAKAVCEFYAVKYVAPVVSKPKPAPTPAPKPNPEAAKVNTYRVKVDGTQVGAYANPVFALAEVEKAIKASKKTVLLERV